MNCEENTKTDHSPAMENKESDDMLDNEDSNEEMLDNKDSNQDKLDEDHGGPESVAFDNVLKAIGVSVKYQVFQSLILVSFMWPYAMALLNFVFVGYEPPHACARANNTELLAKYSLQNDSTAQVLYEMCQIRITSNKTGYPKDVALTGCIGGHDFVGGKHVSLKTEWGLVCEKTGVGELVQTMLNLGMVIGALIVSPLPDKYGRKKILLICSIFTFLFEFAVVFSPTISTVIVLKLISGVFSHNLSVLNNIFGQELLITKKRQHFGIGIVVMWTCGLLLLGLVAYVLQEYSWRTLQLFTSLIGIPPLLLLYFVDESISWLLAEGKHARAFKIIRRLCESSGTDFDAAKRAYDQCVLRAKKAKNNKDENAVAKYGFSDILRHRNLLVTTLILQLAYFTHSTVFFGLYLSLSTVDVNRHVMFIIIAATELPTSFLCHFLIHRVGRKKIVIFFVSTTAISLITPTFLVGLGSPTSEHVSNARTAFFILGKMSINVSYTCLYAFTAEFYPTTLRNIGFGMCALMTRVGGMVSPFLLPLFFIANWAPGTLLLALCIFTICSYQLVPETKDKELPTTIEAFNAMFKKEHKPKKSKTTTNHKTGSAELDCYANRQKDIWNQTLESGLMNL